MEKIAIIVPALNCLEYSKKTIDSIKTSHPYEIIFIDNGSTDGTKDWLETQSFTKIIDPQVSGLAAVWNLGVEKARELNCSLFAILNNDIILSPNALDNMAKKMSTGKYVMVTGVNQQEGLEKPEDMMNIEAIYDENEPDNQHPDFSCFMINENTIQKIGRFDDNFIIAYFEDNDFHARIAISGEKAVSTISAIYYHFSSKTTQSNPHLKDLIKEAFELNRNYFKEKWGSFPLGDVENMKNNYFENPFNNKRKTINDVSLNSSIF